LHLQTCSAHCSASNPIVTGLASALLLQLHQQLRKQQKVRHLLPNQLTPPLVTESDVAYTHSLQLLATSAPVHARTGQSTKLQSQLLLMHTPMSFWRHQCWYTPGNLRAKQLEVSSVPAIAEPRWTPLDRVREIVTYVAIGALVAIPIWIAQGFLALLGVTLG